MPATFCVRALLIQAAMSCSAQHTLGLQLWLYQPLQGINAHRISHLMCQRMWNGLEWFRFSEQGLNCCMDTWEGETGKRGACGQRERRRPGAGRVAGKTWMWHLGAGVTCSMVFMKGHWWGRFIRVEDVTLIVSHRCPPSEENAVALAGVRTASCNAVLAEHATWGMEGQHWTLNLGFQPFCWDEVGVHPKTRRGRSGLKRGDL